MTDKDIIRKVTIEFDNKVLTVEGEEAKKWQEHNKTLSFFAKTHGQNPFDSDPINWKETKK